jgi:hypothetical protein
MRPFLKRIQPMPNVPLAYVSVYRRMSDIFHTLAYASTIRNSVTGPLALSNVIQQSNKTLSVNGSLYQCKLKLQLSRTFLCILLICNWVVSREIWIKQALMSFTKTLNSTRSSDSCYFDAL